jgi:hypothetical protein
MGLKPAPIARVSAIGHAITAETVFDAAYDNIKPKIALNAKMLNSVRCDLQYWKFRYQL